LSSLIRYAYDSDEFINIWDEFEILQKYAAVMNCRYSGKLNIDFDFDDRLMDHSMPRMLIQPIIENAITHGFKNMDSGCEIFIKTELCGNSVYFLIRDNGCGMSDEELAGLEEKLNAAPGLVWENSKEKEYENIALINIKNRLVNYYGDAGQLKIKPGDNGGIEVFVSIVTEIRI